MATGFTDRSLLDQIDEDLACQICLERFTDARALRCQHTFCKECLENMSRNSRLLKCPTCRDLTPVPLQGIDQLPKNYHINSLVDLLRQREEQQGENHGEVCAGCEGRTATTKCIDCAVHLCVGCGNAHKKGKYRNHMQISLLEYGRRERITSSQRLAEYCEKHRTEHLQTFCNLCRVAICRECSITEHSAPNHQQVPLKEAVENLVSRIGAREEKLKQRKKITRNRKASLEQVSQKLSIIHSTEKEKVSAALEKNRYKVREMMNDIIRKLEEDAKEKLDLLDAEYMTESGILQDKLKELHKVDRKLETTGLSAEEALHYDSTTRLLSREEILLADFDDVITMTDDLCIQSPESPNGQNKKRARSPASVSRIAPPSGRGVLDRYLKRKEDESSVGNDEGAVQFVRFVPENCVDELANELERKQYVIGRIMPRSVSPHTFVPESPSVCKPQ